MITNNGQTAKQTPTANASANTFLTKEGIAILYKIQVNAKVCIKNKQRSKH